MSRITYLSESRNLMMVDVSGRHVELHPAVDTTLLWGAWARTTEGPSQFAWPTWSPDASRVAVFRTTDRKQSYVHVVRAGSVESSDLVDIAPRLPIYLRFSPSGHQVAVLAQQQDRLVLTVTHVDRIGSETRVVEGSPLFFTWRDEGHLIAYVGTASRPSRDAATRMIEVDIEQATERAFPGEVAHFCAPFLLGDATGPTVYVAQHEGGNWVGTAHPGAASFTPLAPVEGLPALVPCRDGRRIACAEAPDGDGTPYQRFSILDPDGGPPHRVFDGPFLAYFECADGWLFAKVETARSLVRIHRVGLDGSRKVLCDCKPTRDLSFYLRFFEQFTASHPLVDPTGEWLLLAGAIDGREGGKNPIWRINVRTGDAEPVAEGVFATWSPA
jgi:hypothetical protein